MAALSLVIPIKSGFSQGTAQQQRTAACHRAAHSRAQDFRTIVQNARSAAFTQESIRQPSMSAFSRGLPANLRAILQNRLPIVTEAYQRSENAVRLRGHAREGFSLPIQEQVELRNNPNRIEQARIVREILMSLPASQPRLFPRQRCLMTGLFNRMECRLNGSQSAATTVEIGDLESEGRAIRSGRLENLVMKVCTISGPPSQTTIFSGIETCTHYRVSDGQVVRSRTEGDFPSMTFQVNQESLVNCDGKDLLYAIGNTASAEERSYASCTRPTGCPSLFGPNADGREITPSNPTGMGVPTSWGAPRSDSDAGAY